MRKVIILVLLLVHHIHIKAQEIPFDLKSTELQKDKNSERSFGFVKIGQIDNKAFYLCRPYRAVFNEVNLGYTENYFLRKIDKDMNLIQKVQIDLKQEKKQKQFEGIFILKGELVLFSSFKNQKDKKHYLFAQNINKESLVIDPNLKIIGELDYSGISKYNDTHFQYETSPDGTKVLVFYTLLGNDDETLKFGMYVYNHQLNLQWKNENIFPHFSGGVFSYDKFKVDNNGFAYLLGKHYANTENYYDEAGFKKKGFFSSDTYYTDKPNYKYQLYRYSDSGKKEDLIEFALPNKFIRSLNFLPTLNNSITCAGIYSTPGTISAIGSFTFNVNINSKQYSNINAQDFDKTLIEQGFNENELNRFRRSIENKEEWDPFDYLISEIKTKKNGERYFIAEQFISGTKKERNVNMITYKPIYFHQDLYIINLSADNKIKRIDKVNKNQYMLVTNNFNSYTDIEKDGSLYLTFNTSISHDTMFKNLTVGDSYILSINEKGVQKKSILNKQESSGQPIPMFATAISLEPNTLMYILMPPNFSKYMFQKLMIK